MRARLSLGTTWGLLSTVLVLFLALPGIAAAAPGTGTTPIRPDGRIRLQKSVSSWVGTTKYTDAWTGDNIYNTTASGQTIKEEYYAEAPGWERWIFGVSLENDGASSDRMRVHATGTAVYGWKVKYYVGTNNVTSAVVNGTFTTPSLAPGESVLLKVKVTREELHRDALRRLMSVTSVGNPNKVDAVKLVFEPFTCGC